MNRDEFEKAYADKYTAGDLSVVRDNRDGEGYTDHHIDLCWKVQQVKNAEWTIGSWYEIKQDDPAAILINRISSLEW